MTDIDAEKVWSSLRKEKTLDLAGLTDSELRDIVDSLIDEAGFPATNLGDEARELLTDEARKEAGPEEEVEREKEIEEAEEVTEEELEAAREGRAEERREERLERLGERRPRRERGVGIEPMELPKVKIPEERIPEIRVPPGVELPTVETPGARMERVVSEVERGVEDRISETDEKAEEISKGPVSFGQRVADTARNVRDTIADLSVRVARRIRDLFR
jgi:hypothetical protein